MSQTKQKPTEGAEANSKEGKQRLGIVSGLTPPKELPSNNDTESSIRTRLKEYLMHKYNQEQLPRWVVRTLFIVFRLKHL